MKQGINEFTNSLKVDSKESNKALEMKKFMEMIDGNDDVLNMLSVNRLKILEKYYSDIIIQNDEKIKKLKAKK